MKKPGKRPYHSERRQKQAEQTRASVVAAARRLFFDTGYQATTIEAIAKEAAVSVPTVYGVFGSKRGLMLAISDDMDVRAGFAQIEAEIAASRDPREQLRLIAHGQVEFFRRNADVLESLREAGQTDDGFAGLWKEGHARHHAGYTRLVKRWTASHVLREGLDPAEAADIMAGLTWIDLYWYFVGRRGWTIEQYREWLVRSIETLVLTPAR